ncbi:MAG: DUF6382 domain-containing protein [Coprococcus sp.]
MEVSYRKDACHTYMVVTGSGTVETDDEERMLSNQQSPILLPFHVQQLNGKKDYYYDITGRLDFRSYIEKQQADSTIIGLIIVFLIKIYRTVDEYLLDPGGILLDMTYIYWDMDEKQLYAAYVPGMKESFDEQLQRLASELLENTDHRDKEGVLLVYDFYKTVRREDFSPGLLNGLCKKDAEGRGTVDNTFQGDAKSDFEEVINYAVNEKIQDAGREEEEEKEEKIKDGKKIFYLWNAGTVCVCLLILLVYRMGYIGKILVTAGMAVNESYVAIGIIICVLAFAFILRRQREINQLPAGEDKDEKTVWDDTEFENGGVYSFVDETDMDRNLPDDDRTVVLSGMTGNVRLISLNKNIAADLLLTHFPCVVGSQEAEGQAVIPALGISRRHAVFEKMADGIYLMDMDSTNGTRVNGKKLKKEEKRRLLVEDIIEFADVRYMYCGGGEVEK